MCKTHTNGEQANIIRDLILKNAYSAQLTCSLILNFDWSEKVFWSKFLPGNSAAGKWSQAGHKNLILTTPLKLSGRFISENEIRQNEAAKTKE